MKTKLKALGRFIWDTYRHPSRCSSTRAPDGEAGGAGGRSWLAGKHTNLVSRQFGSWLFLGELLISAELPYDQRRSTIAASAAPASMPAPTKAFPAPYRIECPALHLLSHHRATKARSDPELRPLLGNRIYGCDDCLAACPWNKFAKQAREAAFVPRPALTAPLLAELATLDGRRLSPPLRRHRPSSESAATASCATSPMRWAIAPPRDSLPAIKHLLKDDSALVRDAAAWALSRLT